MSDLREYFSIKKKQKTFKNGVRKTWECSKNQMSFQQPLLRIVPEISDMAGKFSIIFKKFEKRSKNQKFDFSEGNNFLYRNTLRAANNVGELNSA